MSAENRDGEGDLARDESATEKAIAALRSVRSGVRADATELAVPEGFDLPLRGTWRATARNLVGHTIEPMRRSEEGGWVRHFAAESDRPEPLDLPVLARAADRLIELIEAGSPLLVIAPVHWQTLDRQRLLNKYIELCAKLPDEARRQLVLELAGIPEDMLPSRVEQRIRQLRSFCRAVICRVRLERRDFRQLRGLPVHALGVDRGAETPDERAIAAALQGFVEAIAPLRVRAHMQGIDSRPLLLAAAAAGFDYLAGAIIPPGGDPVAGARLDES